MGHSTALKSPPPRGHELQVGVRIVVATEFTDAPGARYRSDGPKSGQEFLEEMLESAFLKARHGHSILFIDLDGTWGYASSFISGAFGRLAKKYGAAAVREIVRYKSDEDPLLIGRIYQEIDEQGNDA